MKSVPLWASLPSPSSSQQAKSRVGSRIQSRLHIQMEQCHLSYICFQRFFGAFPRRKGVCTNTDHFNWQSWFSFTFFKEENRWASNGFICVWYKELSCTLSPAWERWMREEVPKDMWRRVPHHAVLCKGNPSQNRAASETDGLNQVFCKAISV